jgi:hypothetical protein
MSPGVKMPFVSAAQQRFAHANPQKFGGEKKLAEWDQSTDFKTLPERKKKKFNYVPKKKK